MNTDKLLSELKSIRDKYYYDKTDDTQSQDISIGINEAMRVVRRYKDEDIEKEIEESKRNAS